MSTEQCAALATPNTLWSFCPNEGADYAFIAFFGLTFIAHVAQGIYHRKAYSWVISMSALWQLLTYIFRAISIQNPASLELYAVWFVLILVAPLWTNAYIYMVFGRMVWNFTRRARVFKITAWRFTFIFVVLDIVAFAVQIYGAASTQGKSNTAAEVLHSLHIYMAGVGIQEFFILVFLVYAIGFHRQLLFEDVVDHNTKKQALMLLYTLYVCIALITMRIVFRICEYSQGFKSTIPNHEAYQYCLDSLPMLLALVALNIMHPGRIMPGKKSDMPSHKARKNGVRSKFDAKSSSMLDEGVMSDLDTSPLA